MLVFVSELEDLLCEADLECDEDEPLVELWWGELEALQLTDGDMIDVPDDEWQALKDLVNA